MLCETHAKEKSWLDVFHYQGVKLVLICSNLMNMKIIICLFECIFYIRIMQNYALFLVSKSAIIGLGWWYLAFNSLFYPMIMLPQSFIITCCHVEFLFLSFVMCSAIFRSFWGLSHFALCNTVVEIDCLACCHIDCRWRYEKDSWSKEHGCDLLLQEGLTLII